MTLCCVNLCVVVENVSMGHFFWLLLRFTYFVQEKRFLSELFIGYFFTFARSAHSTKLLCCFSLPKLLLPKGFCEFYHGTFSVVFGVLSGRWEKISLLAVLKTRESTSSTSPRSKSVRRELYRKRNCPKCSHLLRNVRKWNAIREDASENIQIVMMKMNSPQSELVAKIS